MYVCKRAFVEVTGLLNIDSGLFGDWRIRECRCQARGHGFVHATAAGELAKCAVRMSLDIPPF